MSLVVNVLGLNNASYTHATLLFRAGVSPKEVSVRFGHANIGITLDIYSHVLPDMQEDAADKIDKALGAGVGEAVATT